MRTLSKWGTDYTTVPLRLALGIAFLSSVADRLGLWGRPGAKNVAWGNFGNFVAFTAILNPYAPSSVIRPMAWVVTLAEVTLGLLLIVGFRVRETATASAVLLLLFAVGMAIGLGIKAPLDYSVFAASTAGFLLAAHWKSPLSIDALFSARGRSSSRASRLH